MKIPTNNQWTQTNEGDILGVLNSTRNMTVDQAGKIQLSRKSFAHISSANTGASFDNVIAILYYGSNYIVVTSDEMYKYSNSHAVTEISSTPTLSSDSDAIVFNSLVHVISNNNLDSWDGGAGSGAWDNDLLAVDLNDNPHPMAIFDSLPTFKLAIADGNQVKTYDTSYNKNSTTLTLPSQFEITTMQYRNGYLYVGTRNLNGGEARVFIWSGDGADAQYEVPVGAEKVLSMTPYSSTVACVVNSGELFLINGSSKERLAALPVFFEPNIKWGKSDSNQVAHRGMLTVRDSIYINIEGDVYGDDLASMKSGLWVYNPSSGLNHMAAPSTDTFVKDNSLSVSDSTITTSVAHNLINGDSVTFHNTAGLVGVSNDTIYYVEVISATELKLSTSRRALKANEYLTITGTPTVGDELIYTPNTDYGEYKDASGGAIGRVVLQEQLDRNWNTDVFFASRTEDQDGTTVYTMCGLTDAYNIGSMVTQRVYSDNITQVWKSLYAFIDGIDSDVEEAVVKYRTEQQQSKPTQHLSGTWLNATTINSDPTATANDWGAVNIGDEVYVVSGQGQGRSAHVTKITKTTSVYSVELDESFGVAGKTVKVVADNWKKSGVITSTRKERDYLRAGITPEAKGAWVQLKIELRGFQPKVSRLELINSVDKSAV